MKKILVVLMILAVAGGVFAQQGTWSLSSNAAIGARINFDPDPENEGDVALIRGSMYQRPYNDYTSIFGSLGLNYSRGALGVGLTFSTEGTIVGNVNATGENYKFQVAANLNEFWGPGAGAINGGAPGGIPQSYDKKFPARLWGSYSLLNELVLLEIAYRSRDTELWVSDKTAAIDDNGFQIPNTYSVSQDASGKWTVKKRANARGYDVMPGNVHDYTAATPSGGLFGERNTFSKVDGNNYLLGNISTGGLELGMMLPNFFPTPYTADLGGRYDGKTPAMTAEGAGVGSNYPGRWLWGNQLIDDVLMQSVFGAKFTMQPIEVAAQIKLEDFGVYFGGKFFAGPITVGLSFMGTMGKTVLDLSGTGGPQYPDTPNVQKNFGSVFDGSVAKLGARVDYNGGSFGAGIKGFWGQQGGKGGTKDFDGNITGDQLDYYFTIIGIEPVFYINAIPSHLKFTLNAGMYFETYTAPDITTNASSDIKATYWALQPELTWNFRGTGAVGGYHSMNTGMLFRYRVVSNSVNALDLAFLFGL